MNKIAIEKIHLTLGRGGERVLEQAALRAATRKTKGWKKKKRKKQYRREMKEKLSDIWSHCLKNREILLSKCGSVRGGPLTICDFLLLGTKIIVLLNQKFSERKHDGRLELLQDDPYGHHGNFDYKASDLQGLS